MLKPAGHRVLVKPDPIEETDDTMAKAKEMGLEIIKDAQTKRAEEASQVVGTIVSIGNTAWVGFDDGEPWAHVGNRVLYSKYGGRFVQDPDTDEEFVVLNDEDIICIVERD